MRVRVREEGAFWQRLKGKVGRMVEENKREKQFEWRHVVDKSLFVSQGRLVFSSVLGLPPPRATFGPLIRKLE